MARIISVPVKGIAALIAALLLVGFLPTAAFASMGSITLSPGSGIWGTSVGVTGSGWAGSRVLSLTFGGTEIKTCTTASNGNLGNNACVFNVPNVNPDTYTVALTDTTNATFTRSTDFQVTLTSSLSPSSGPAGTVTGVSGAGFRPNEPVSFTFDGQAIAPAAPCSTTPAGAFSNCQLTVPPATAGAKPIVASDGVRSRNSDFTVQVTTGTLTVGSGTSHWGTSVTPTGTGWPSSRTAANPIVIRFAGTAVGDCTTNNSGVLGCPAFQVPDRTPASYQVTATDSQNSFSVREVSYTISAPSTTLSPTGGAGHTTTGVSGSGFKANSPITFTVAGAAADPAPLCTASPTGTFSGCAVKVPYGTTGNKTIVALDNDGRTASADYNLQFTQGTVGLSAPSGNTGSTVTVTGSNWTAGSTAIVRFDSEQVATCAVGSSGGSSGTLQSCTFRVPAAAAGSYTVRVVDGTNEFNTNTAPFSVNPAGITLTPGSGAIGSTVALSGHGFRANLTAEQLVLTFGGQSTSLTNCTTDAYGVLSNGCQFTVPNVAGGPKNVVLRDLPLDGQRAAENTYTVNITAALTLTPDNGPAGTLVTATGSGWTPNGDTANGTVLSMGGEFLTRCATTAAGALSACTFRIPAQIPGLNTVDAVDGTNSFNRISRALGIAATDLTLSSYEGGTGTPITASATGFRRDADVQILFDGSVITTCVADAYGAFNGCGFTVPASPTKGSKPVVARDLPLSDSDQRSVTRSFNLTTSIDLAPLRGIAGTAVTVTGEGFGNSQSARIDWGSPVTNSWTTCATSSTGTLTGCTFNVPSLATIGTYRVTVTSLGSSAQHNRSAAANFLVVHPTAASTAAAEGTYGGAADLTSTLTSAGSPVSGKTMTFRLNGSVVGTAVTNTSGVASLANASLAGISANTYPTGVSASFAGDATHATVTQTAALVVNKKSVTGSFTAADKQYDANTSAMITGRFLSGAVPGDTVSLTGGTATFTNKAIGSNKTVNGTGFSLTGSLAANYDLQSAELTTLASITKRTLTVAFTAANKVYDGTSAATVTPGPLSGILGDDEVSLTTVAGGATATFANKNIGSGKTVTVTGGYSLTGTDAGNYSVATPDTTTANITPRDLTVNAHGVGRQYDRTNVATVTLSTPDRQGSDTVNMTYSTATFNDKNAGEKSVAVSGIAISGTDASNYNLKNTTAQTTATITKRDLTVSATAADKVYNNNLLAIVTLTDNRLAGDVLTASASSATFNTKNVGTDKPVTVTGISISGTDAQNYNVNTTANTAASITRRPLAVAATGVDKVYIGTVAATVTLTTNKLNGDDVTASNNWAAFDDKNIGINKPISVSGISLSGLDAPNYELASTTTTTSASITRRTLVVTPTAQPKVYDATRTVSVSLADDRVAGDTFTISSSSLFDTKDVGPAKAVTVSGISLSGGDSNNYTVAPTATTTAAIAKRNLTVAATGTNKVYDATTAATVLLTTNDRQGTDVVSLSHTGATFASKDVSPGKQVSVSGISISGTDATNYNLTNTTTTTTADITKRNLTVAATGVDRVYNALTGATASLTTTDRQGADTVNLAYTGATFGSKDAGTNKAVSVSGISIDGADAANYNLTNTTANTTASISKRNLAVTATGVDKVYNGSNVATVNLATTDRLGSDVVNLSYASATFNDKNVGTNKPVSVTGIAISGADAANYNLNNTTAGTTANITKADGIVIDFTVEDKVYDGTKTATLKSATIPAGAVAPGDEGQVEIDVTSGTRLFTSADAGPAPQSVTWSGIVLTGPRAGNYTVASTPAATTATISAQTLTGSFEVNNKVYDGDAAAAIKNGSRSLTGLVEGDDVTLTGGTASFASKHVGTRAVTGSGFALDGAPAANYNLTSVSAPDAQITPRRLTVTAVAADKTFDNSTATTAELSDNRVANDVLNVAYANAAFATATAGSNKAVSVTGITVTGDDAGNYTWNATAATTASISYIVGFNAYRPDGLVSLKSGYGYKDSLTSKVVRSRTRTLYIRTVNEGQGHDSFKVKGTSTTAVKVRYFAGATDVTSKVLGGTYTTPVLAAKGTHTLRAVYTVGRGVALKTYSLPVKMTSTSPARTVDTVAVKIQAIK